MFKSLFSTQQKPASEEPIKSQTESTPQNPSTVLDSEKIKALLADLVASDEIFLQAGFLLEQLEIELGQIPKVIPTFKQIKDISVDKESAIIDSQREKKLIQFLLTTLFKSSRMKSLMKDSHLHYHGIEIDITASPSVKTIFKRDMAHD